MLTFKEQQQITSTLIRPLWKPLTKSGQKSCLSRWMIDVKAKDAIKLDLIKSLYLPSVRKKTNPESQKINLK